MIGLVLVVSILFTVVDIFMSSSYWCYYDQPQYDSTPPWSTISTISYCDSSAFYSPFKVNNSSLYFVTNSVPWSRRFSYVGGILTYPLAIVINRSTISAGLTFLCWITRRKIGSICCRWGGSFFIVIFSLLCSGPMGKRLIRRYCCYCY